MGKERVELEKLVEGISRIPIVDITDAEHTWFISDPHFDHANIIKYCNRPFRTIEEMNETILRNWNETIGPNDLVFFVGDMSFGRGSRRPKWWLAQLNGRKIYLKGSHDHGIRPTTEGLDNVLFVSDAVIVRLDGKSVYVAHDPWEIPRWWRGWAIHGHVHNEKPHVDRKWRRINVSVEVVNYRPYNATELTNVLMHAA